MDYDRKHVSITHGINQIGPIGSADRNSADHLSISIDSSRRSAGLPPIHDADATPVLIETGGRRAKAWFAAANESDKQVSSAALRFTRSVTISRVILVKAPRLVEALEKQV